MGCDQRVQRIKQQYDRQKTNLEAKIQELNMQYEEKIQKKKIPQRFQQRVNGLELRNEQL